MSQILRNTFFSFCIWCVSSVLSKLFIFIFQMRIKTAIIPSFSNCMVILLIADTASELRIHQYRALGQKPVWVLQQGGTAGQFSSASDRWGDPSTRMEICFHGCCGRRIRWKGECTLKLKKPTRYTLNVKRIIIVMFLCCI